MNRVFKSHPFRAVSACVMALGLLCCGGTKALVLVDRPFELLSPASAAAFRAFSPRGTSTVSVTVDGENVDDAVRHALERTKPSVVLATPALVHAVTRAASTDGITVASIASSPEPLEGSGLAATFESERAYRALGLVLGGIVADYDRNHPDRSYCGVLVSENPNRPPAWLAAFRDAYAVAAPPDSLALRVLPQAFQPDQLERALAELETYNLSAIFVCPPGLFPTYRQRFPGIAYFEDRGDYYYPAPPERRDGDGHALLRDLRMAVKALETAYEDGVLGRIPVPITLNAEKNGGKPAADGRSAEALYERAY